MRFKKASLFILSTMLMICLFKVVSIQAAVHEHDSYPYIVGISDKHKFVWFRVAKVGSSTVKSVFFKNNVNLSIKSDRFWFRPKEYKNYFKFAFVRNPWDRVVSCYCQKVENKNPSWAHYYGECFDKGFEYFINFIDSKDLTRADRHIRLQTTLIPVKDVNFIGRLESFAEDLQYVLGIIGVKDYQIPKKNPSNHGHYSTYYNETTKAIIARKYQDDIEAFGYQFEVR
ncbi:MAG: sulfotransferase family protein, partial [Rickettsia endosymbiont of Ixodes persulcatus]|nr:sulfotransferase family protein [Rickettsia endosymbiont of Ixodes persulcatus]